VVGNVVMCVIADGTCPAEAGGQTAGWNRTWRYPSWAGWTGVQNAL